MWARFKLADRVKGFLRQHRIVLRVAYAFLNLLLVTLALAAIWNLITYLLIRPQSEFEAAIEDADSFMIRMDHETCNADIGSLNRDFLTLSYYRPQSHFNRVFLLLESKTEPISVTLSLANGYVSTRAELFLDHEVITSSREITGDIDFRLMAREVYLDFGNPQDAIVTHDVCTELTYYSPFSGYLSFVGTSERASILSKPQFIHSGQPITVTLQDVTQGHLRFDTFSIQFQAGADYFRSDASFLMRGQDMQISVPSRHPSTVGKYYLPLTEARTSALLISDPIGSLDVESDGLIKLSPSPAGRMRTLYFGYPNDSMYKPQGFVLVYRDSLAEPGAPLYRISGYTSTIRLDQRELIANRWENASPEVQAVIVTTALALLGWFVRKLLLKLNCFGKHLEDSEPESPKIPLGYTILVLASGLAVAGKLARSPSWRFKKYVLRDVFVQDHRNAWSSEPIPEIAIEADSVVYSFLKQSSCESNPPPLAKEEPVD